MIVVPVPTVWERRGNTPREAGRYVTPHRIVNAGQRHRAEANVMRSALHCALWRAALLNSRRDEPPPLENANAERSRRYRPIRRRPAEPDGYGRLSVRDRPGGRSVAGLSNGGCRGSETQGGVCE